MCQVSPGEHLNRRINMEDTREQQETGMDYRGHPETGSVCVCVCVLVLKVWRLSNKLKDKHRAADAPVHR